MCGACGGPPHTLAELLDVAGPEGDRDGLRARALAAADDGR